MSIPEIGTEFKFVGSKKVGCYGLPPLNTWRDGDTVEVVAHVKMQGGNNPLYWNARDMSSSTVREDLLEIIPATNPQPKPWSGPEDGLPPVGTTCEALNGLHDQWRTVLILDHEGSVPTAACRDWENRLWWSQEFRAIETPEQLSASARETAIRELMDIAQVDCRVTAARLVDAGFKREVV